MKLKTFIGWLNYRECEELENNNINFIYRNKNNPHLLASISKEDEIHRTNMYNICTSLGIDMPPEHKDYQDTLDRIP